MVAERLAWEAAGPPPLAAPASAAWRRLAQEKTARAAGGPFDYFGMALPWARFPDSLAALNPGLLEIPPA